MAENNFQNATMVPSAGQPTQGFDPRNKHPEYNASEEAWQTSHDVYKGAEGMVPRNQTYIPRRKRGEDERSYAERLSLAHYSGLLGALVDALVGLWSRRAPESDEWGDLGARDGDGKLAAGSKALAITEDADRNRTTWENHRRESATWLLIFNRAYTLVDTNKPATAGEITKEQAQATGIRGFVTRVSPLDLLDWVEQDGRKVDVVIRERTDPRTSLDAGAGSLEERYLRLRLDGWERLKVVKDGDRVRVETVGTGSYAYHDVTGRLRLPLIEKRLPLTRHAAYNLARMVLAIVNHDSHYDSLLRAGALGQYLALQGDEEEARKSIEKGDKVLTYPVGSERPDFVGYGMDAAGPLKERIQELNSAFWRAAMYEFSDRAAEKTATEMEQEWASGIGAFLTLLAGAMEEGENEEKFLLAQANGVTDGGQTVFAREYKIEDVVAELQRIKELVFGLGSELPLSDSLKAATTGWILKRLDSQHGVLEDVKGADVTKEVEGELGRRELERTRISGLEQEMATKPGFPEEQGEIGRRRPTQRGEWDQMSHIRARAGARRP